MTFVMKWSRGLDGIFIKSPFCPDINLKRFDSIITSVFISSQEFQVLRLFYIFDSYAFFFYYFVIATLGEP